MNPTVNKDLYLSLSILIIDPNKAWVSSLHCSLEEKKFLSTTVDNGKDAQLLIYKNKYQIAILDLDVINHSCLEVLRYIKLNASAMKVIVTVSSQARLVQFNLTSEELLRMGASVVLIKPIRIEIILKHLEGEYNLESWKDLKQTTESKNEQEVKASDEEFTRISFDDFFSGSVTIFDLYIRLAKHKFIKVLHQGESFHVSRLQKYKDSNLDYLYFKTSDRTIYINYSNELLKKVIGSSQVSNEKKVNLAETTVEKYLEQVYECGLKSALIEQGKSICQNMYNLIQSEPDLMQIMKSYEEYDASSYSHLFLVSFFSALTCRNLEWAGGRTVEVVALGALLHDIGMMKLPISVREKKPSEMNQKELEIYQSHPKLGAELLSSFPTIPEAVKQIVYQHHEYANGEGFPNKMNNLKIYPPAKIVSLNADYVMFIMERKITPIEGIKLFIKDRSVITKYDPLILKALVTGFMKDK